MKHQTSSASGLYYGFLAIVFVFILFIAITMIAPIAASEAAECYNEVATTELQRMNQLDCELGQ